jgi:hypothetical protein
MEAQRTLKDDQMFKSRVLCPFATATIKALRAS